MKELRVELNDKIKYMNKVIKSYDTSIINTRGAKNTVELRRKQSFFEGMKAGYVNLLMEI